MRAPRILVVGSFVMDQIVETDVFPNEGQSVFGNTFHKATGGKGANQAVQMARLGADVTMIGKLGKDSNGADMVAACEEAGIHCEHILFDEEAASGCAVIVLEKLPSGQTANRIIVVPGANMKITKDEIAFLEETISDYDMVLLQLEVPMEINELVAEYAFKKNVPVMLNSAPFSPISKELCSHLAFISPNEHEANDLVGIRVHHSSGNVDLDEARQATAAIKELGVKNALITLGEAGAVLDTEEGEFFFSPCAKDVCAVDPTAAGDSFVGSFCVAVSVGARYDEALQFANHVAALTVSRLGAQPSLPRLEEVKEFLTQKGIEPMPFLAQLSNK